MQNKCLIVFHPKKLSLSLLKECLEWLKKNGYSAVFSEEEAEFLGKKDKIYNPLADEVDFVLSLGGDGTFLRAASIIKGKASILGVNLGGLGFLTKIRAEELFDILKEVISKKLKEEQRLMLQAEIEDKTFFALNDVVISKKGTKVCKIKVNVNNECAGMYKADGIIVSTPTGSTAYSLSAGGPIIEGSADVFLIIPICPHAPSVRPLIVPSSSKVEIEAESDASISVSVDGHISVEVEKVDAKILKAPFSTRLFSVGKGFYKTLKEKLNWPS